jgi:hypothetical protein
MFLQSPRLRLSTSPYPLHTENETIKQDYEQEIVKGEKTDR